MFLIVIMAFSEGVGKNFLNVCVCWDHKHFIFRVYWFAALAVCKVRGKLRIELENLEATLYIQACCYTLLRDVGKGHLKYQRKVNWEKISPPKETHWLFLLINIGIWQIALPCSWLCSVAEPCNSCACLRCCCFCVEWVMFTAGKCSDCWFSWRVILPKGLFVFWTNCTNWFFRVLPKGWWRHMVHP